MQDTGYRILRNILRVKSKTILDPEIRIQDQTLTAKVFVDIA